MNRHWFLAAVLSSGCAFAFDGPREADWDNQLLAARRLVEQAHFAEAEQILVSTVRDVEAVQPGTVLLPMMLNSLGILCHDAGRPLDAEAYFERALRLSQQAGEKYEGARIRAMLNLGSVFLELGRLAEAKRFIRNAGAEPGFERGDGERPWRVHTLALLRYQFGDYAEAEELSSRAVRMWEAEAGTNNPTLVVPLNMLSTILVKRNRIGEALPVVRRMLSLMHDEASIPPLHRAKLLANSAEVLLLAGNVAEAESLASEAVEIAQNRLASNNAFLSPILLSHAAVLRRLKRKAEARKIEKRARQILNSAAVENGMRSVVDIRELGRKP